MKRGEIWTQSGGPGYAGKPRPALIVQSDLLIGTDSVVTCLFTTDVGAYLPSRIGFVPDAANGLRDPSDLMADKITAVSRDKLGTRIGAVSEDKMEQVERALLIVLGFAG